MSADLLAHAPLDIALLAPLVAPIRQPFLGGAQALLRDLAVVLAARGHSVTLYAAQGSDPDALPGVALAEVAVDADRVRPTDFSALRERPRANRVDPAVEQAFARAFTLIATHTPQHEILHAHTYDAPAFRQAQALSMPVAHTLHMTALDPTISAVLAALAPARQPRAPRQPWLVTVSHACAATYADVCHIDDVIYNGLNIDAIPFAPLTAPEAGALFAGRITPEKGVVDAIEIALRVGVRLQLIGDIYDHPYFSSRVAPLLDAHPGAISYLGPQTRERVWQLMAESAVVLVPSLWDEPFGLVACEALATGTPVVGYDSGGLREVVAQGETGILVPRGQTNEAAAALRQASQLSRSACRQRVENLFSLQTTVERYEAFYRRMRQAPA